MNLLNEFEELGNREEILPAKLPAAEGLLERTFLPGPKRVRNNFPAQLALVRPRAFF